MAIDTLSITSYEMKSKTLARVIISYTGYANSKNIRDAIAAKFDHLAAPVEDSFRIVKAGVAVGFLRANKEVRVPKNEQEIRAGYRTLATASNILMDKKDKSLWELKEGRGQKYLARQGHEDLSELIESNVMIRPEIPHISRVQCSAAVAGEFVSFVAASGNLDHGFSVAANDKKVLLVSTTTKTPIVVPYDMVTAIAPVPIPKSFAKDMVKAGISRADKDQAIEYWKKLYSYDPDYLADVIDQVNQGTIA